MAIEIPPVWDLSDLYSGMNDPRIQETIDEQMQCADEFAARYRGKIDSPDLDAPTLHAAVKEYESIFQEADKPISFASLLFSADTSDPARGAFYQRMRELHSDITIKLMFFDLELMAVPEDHMSRLLTDPALDHYRHYIWAQRLFRDYRLSEPEEKILEEKANTGKRAFTRLFEQTVSNIPFKPIRDTGAECITLPEVLALLRDPSREIRRSAAETLTEGLTENSRTLTHIFNTLIQDKATDDRMRKHTYPEQSRHISNELDPETVEVVVKTAVDSYPLAARYYRLKREILGYDKLMHYDRYAPLFTPKEEVPFGKARQIVHDSFGGFSPVLGEAVNEFFKNGWIDAEVRKGKRGGAFCSYITPDLHPYLFVNYLNRMDDVMTLGHEMGHGVHAYLARGQNYVNFSPVLPVAELASTFGEMLVFETLQSEAGPEDKLALYAEKIEGAFATIFRQAAMYRFEQEIHIARREKGELTTEEFSAVWQRRQQEMFGDSLELGEEHRLWWMYVSHFVSTPFYVYAYTFGELLVMALYAMYEREGESFPPKYLELLRTGGATSPTGLLSRIGIDIHDPAFWQGGIDVLSSLIDRFEELYREYDRNES